MNARHQPRTGRFFGGGARLRRCVLLAALVLGVIAATAQAQNPLTPLPSQPSTTPTVSVPAPITSTSSTTGGSLSSTEQIGLFAAGIILIGGIAFLIRRDAHAQAPAGRAAGTGPRATIKPRAKRVEQSRAKAKAARRQRKRTR